MIVAPFSGASKTNTRNGGRAPQRHVATNGGARLVIGRMSCTRHGHESHTGKPHRPSPRDEDREARGNGFKRLQMDDHFRSHPSISALGTNSVEEGQDGGADAKLKWPVLAYAANARGTGTSSAVLTTTRTRLSPQRAKRAALQLQQAIAGLHRAKFRRGTAACRRGRRLSRSFGAK